MAPLLQLPPTELLVNKTHELWITVFLGALCLAALGYALWHWRRSGRPLVLMLWLAGGSMLVFEPLVDTVGACWFAANSWIVFTAYGRPMPLWLCEAYFFYFGIGSAAVWMALAKGATSRQITLIFLAAMVGDFLFENVLLAMAPYAYYANQPLKLGAFAMWWMPVNGLIPIVLGAVIHRFENYFRGWRVLTIVPIGLTTSAAVNAGVGWPSWFVINTPMDRLPTQLGGLATFAAAFAILRVVCHFVAISARSGRPGETLRPHPL